MSDTDLEQIEMARLRGEMLAARIREQGANYRYYLVKLLRDDDMYYQTVVTEPHLNSREMSNLRKLAHQTGFRVDIYRLATIEEMERFLLQFQT